MYYVYAIKSRVKNYIYVGMTNNPERRIKEHNDRREGTTRSFAPFEVIMIEGCESRLEARKKEKYFKTGVGREYLRSL